MGERKAKLKEKIFAQRKARNGTAFKIKETGMNWTLYVKERGNKSWNRVQSMANAKILKQIMDNQREFRK